jgi:hypothetical protein
VFLGVKHKSADERTNQHTGRIAVLFVGIYQCLRNSNDLLYMIQQPLEDALGDFTVNNDNGDYRDRREISIEVQSTMLHTMESELRECFSNINAYVMLVELKALFTMQVRIMKYEYGDKFFQLSWKRTSA